MNVRAEIIESAKTLSKRICSGATGVYTIKLRSLLELAQIKKISPEYKSRLPPVGLGSITLVDQVVIILMVKLVSPKTIVEIGTFQGFTTRLLLENGKSDCTVHSIDLPQDSSLINFSIDDEKKARSSETYNDDYLRRIQVSTGEIYLSDLPEKDKVRLSIIKQDSKRLSFSKVFKNVDLVFIDGGHDVKTVHRDSENAFDVVTNGVIIWHDFKSDIHAEVTKYIKSESSARAFFFINNSLSCFTVCGDAKKVFDIQ